MRTIRDIFRFTVENLQSIYNKREAESISELLLCELLAVSRTNLIIRFDDDFPKALLSCFYDFLERLKNAEPIQYVLNKAWFYGLEFYVDKNVLIPRQETEILVKKIIELVEKNKKLSKILDIGTGSGCIPISIKKQLVDCDVFALDISEKALDVAKKNAFNNNVEIKFFKQDIFQDIEFSLIKNSTFDIIVSNPPYVLNSEKCMMHSNVLEYEPDLALFVEAEDPLIFYRRISVVAKKLLNQNGYLAFEINEKFYKEVIEVNRKNGFEENFIFNDLNNKPRVIIFKK